MVSQLLSSPPEMWVIALIGLFVTSLCAQTDSPTELERLVRWQRSVPPGATFKINAVTSGKDGYLYLAGLASLPELPQKAASFFTSQDLGRTFDPVRGQAIGRVEAIAVNPRLPSTWLARTFAGIYKTTDSAATWRLVHAFRNEGTGPIEAVSTLAFHAADPSRAFCAFRQEVLASFDGGDTWRRVANVAGGRIQFDPTNPSRVVSGSQLSRDGGRTFEQLAAKWLSFDSSGRLWGYTGAIQMSADEGRTWTVKPAPSVFFNYDLLADPDHANVLYFVSWEGVFRSSDGGSTWTRLPLLSTIRSRILRPCGPEGPLVVLNLGATVQWSSDSGATIRSSSLTPIADLAFGPNCSTAAALPLESDAFVTKLTPDGTTELWTTVLGGSGMDSATAVVADDSGSVYVAGNTTSADFGSDSLRPPSAQGLFVSKLHPDGSVAYTTLPGQTFELKALAVGSDGRAVLVGAASSDSIPVTSDAAQPAYGGGVDGFILRLSPNGQPEYASYFGGSGYDDLVAAASLGSRIAVAGWTDGTSFAGRNSFLGLLMEDGRIRRTSELPEVPLVMAVSPRGEIAIAGVVRSVRCEYRPADPLYDRATGDLFVARFREPDLPPSVNYGLAADCQSSPTGLAFTSDRTLVLSAATMAWAFPLRTPLFAGFAAGVSRRDTGVLVYLGGHSELLFSTYAPQGLVAANNSIYTAPYGQFGGSETSAAKLRVWPGVTHPPPVQLHSIVNAFSGKGTLVVPGSLVALFGSHLGPDEGIDLGLNAQATLPKVLGGTRVLFDGAPAPILATSSNRIICVVPHEVRDWTRVQVEFEGTPSNTVAIAVERRHHGLLTRNFPDLPSFWSVLSEGNIRNTDGTLNSPENPAEPDSTIYIFATGLAVPPGLEAGSIAGKVPITNNNPAFCQGCGSGSFEGVQGATLPGFVTAIYGIPVKAPKRSGRNEISISTEDVRSSAHSTSNAIWVYVK
ncbi:MAG: SBBP repeat-containing protein [Bryobacterales bacterium]|nr:SBBP repeat-containing protein [Bryobacterales bacterium]